MGVKYESAQWERTVERLILGLYWSVACHRHGVLKVIGD